jgi:hypothetical protein
VSEGQEERRKDREDRGEGGTRFPYPEPDSQEQLTTSKMLLCSLKSHKA